MGKYGKKNNVSLDVLSYNIGILGESGIGKSTLVKEMCEKLVGDEGYIALDIGKEDGHDAIQGIVSEKIEDWAKFDDVLTDIIENKDEDYPQLRTVIIDTYDELCLLAEQEVIRLHNRNRKDDSPKIDSINAAYGGFGRGLDKAIELILDKLWELKKVGVSFIIVAHTKKRDIDDVMSQEQYSILTSNTSQKYFNAIKTKLHFLGMAYIDRAIVKESTGRKDMKTKQDIMKGKVVSESRVINFRDDTYSVDSKSRFADIVDKISFNVDDFIQAMKDAIENERSKSSETLDEAKAREKKEAKAAKEKATEYSKNKKDNAVDEEKNEMLIEEIKKYFMDAAKEVKNEVTEYMKSQGYMKFDVEVPTKVLETCLKALKVE